MERVRRQVRTLVAMAVLILASTTWTASPTTAVPSDDVEDGYVTAGEPGRTPGGAVWHDYLFDDAGADVDGFHSGTPDPFTPVTGVHPSPDGELNVAPTANNGRFRWTGDYIYPGVEDGSRLLNVADVARVRIDSRGQFLDTQVELSTLVEADPAVVALAMDVDGPDEAEPARPWPFEAGVSSSGWDVVLTLTSSGEAFLTTSTASVPLAEVGGTAAVDLEANTLSVTVPLSALGASRDGTLVVVGASGRWDPPTGSWRNPTLATGSGRPGTRLPVLPRVYDLAFNGETANTWWNEDAQATLIAGGDVSAASWSVTLDPSGGANEGTECRSGIAVRNHRSDFPLGEGVEIERSGSGLVRENYRYLSDLQPYMVALPSQYCTDDEELPLDMFLHPSNGNHNVWPLGYAATAPGTTTYTVEEPPDFSAAQERLDRDGRIVAGTLARGENTFGPGGDGRPFQYGAVDGGAQEILEVLGEVQDTVAHDPRRVRLEGMSLGAFHATMLGPLYPDRFNALVAWAGGNYGPRLESLRNLPLVSIHGDGPYELLCCYGSIRVMASTLDDLGYPFIDFEWVGRGHDFNLVHDGWDLANAWTTAPAPRSPGRVTYLRDPLDVQPGIPALDGAYWATLAPDDPARQARIDLTSLGLADELPTEEHRFEGAYESEMSGDVIYARGLSHVELETLRARFPHEVMPGWRELSFDVTTRSLAVPEVGNGLSGTVENVRTLAIDLEDARIDPSEPVSIDITTTTPLTLRLGDYEVELDAGRTQATLDLSEGTS